MGRFDLRTETIHADWWEEDEDVVVKERTWADDQRLASDTLGGRVKLRDVQNIREVVNEAEFDLADMNARMLLRSIESWTLKGKDGKVSPLDMEHVLKLTKRDGDFIMEAVVALNPQRDEEFQDDSPDGVPDRKRAAAARNA